MGRVDGRWGGEKSAGGAVGVEKRGLGLIGVGLIRGRGDGEASRREETWS